MSKRLLSVAAIVLAAAIVHVGAQSQAPAGAQDLLRRSLAAHGGERLSSWRTMAITGTIEMEDGVTYRAAYRLQAKMPDKLKVEEDMTVDRGGRYTYEYFLNGKQVWSRRNLIVNKADPSRLQRWMNQCFGVAYYATHATSVTSKGEATADWLTKSGAAYQVSERRPAYVLTVTTDSGTTDLYIDKTTSYLLQETTPDARRLYAGFRDFGGTIHPTRILEITRGRGGADVITPITYEVVRYGVPIEDWVFEEDMPKYDLLRTGF